ncbi:MAG: phage tail fiber protein [Burkholderiaceae bacterium]
MAGFSNSLANALINSTLRGAALPTIRNRYFALFSADPTDAFNAGTEVVGAWYVRQPTGAFAAPTNGSTYNSTSVPFPPVSGSAVTVTHVGVVEGSSPTDPTSTLLYSVELPIARTMQINDVYDISSIGSDGDWKLSLV